MKIFICAGHNMKTVGAVAFDQTEAAINISLVNQAIEILRSQDTKGREIVLVPHELDLMDSIRWVNSQSKDYAHDLALEVHLNSNAGPAGTGTETYYGMKSFSDKMQAGLVEVLGLKNRGSKPNMNFKWNNSTKPGSCLVELGFINNADDLAIVRGRGGRALANGIMKVIGGTLSATTVPKPPMTTAKLTGDFYGVGERVLYHIKNPDEANQYFVNWGNTKPITTIYTCPKSDCSAIQSVLDSEVEKLRLLQIDKIRLEEELKEVRKQYETSQKNPQTVTKVEIKEVNGVDKASTQDLVKELFNRLFNWARKE